MISYLVNQIFNLLFLIIIVVIFLSWIPNVDWNHPVIKGLKTLTELVLAPFRKIIPPINGLDLSPIIAILILQLIQIALVRCLAAVGL